MNALQSNDFNQTVTTKTASYTPTTAVDVGTRLVMNSASATTITINTSIYSASDTLVIQNIGAGVTTLTAGTCTISSAGPLAIPQYGGGTLFFSSASAAIYFPSAVTIPAASSALTLITNQSFTGATTTLANVFSATYENYLVKASNVVSSSGKPRFRFRFGAGTSHNFNSEYYNPPSTGSVDSSGTAGNFISFAVMNTSGNNEQLNLSADIMSPFLTKPTGLNGFSVGGDLYTTLTTAVETSSTSFTDLVLSNSTAVSMSGQIQIYGYSLS